MEMERDERVGAGAKERLGLEGGCDGEEGGRLEAEERERAVEEVAIALVKLPPPLLELAEGRAREMTELNSPLPFSPAVLSPADIPLDSFPNV